LNTFALLDINKKWNNFSLHANLGANHQDNTYNSASTGGSIGIPNVYNVGNILSHPYNIGFSETVVNSVYGAADLGYRNYLFLTLTGREDWFSTLNPKTDHFLYPSVVGSFVFSDAWKMPDWITFGKLRASYAQSSGVGNVGAYQSSLYYGNQVIPYNAVTFSSINGSTVPNASLKPVSIRETEIGTNMSFLKGRLSADIAVYNKQTDGDILGVTIDQTSGYTSPLANVGKLRNRGIEVLLSGYPIKTPTFSWKPSFNFATNSSQVLFIENGSDDIVAGNTARFGTLAIHQIVGKQFGQLVGYDYKTNKTGQRMYDASGLPIRADNQTPLGSGVYRVTGGFNNEFRYKNFLFSFLLDYKFGAKIYSVSNLVMYTDGLSKVTLQGRTGAGYVGKGVGPDGSSPNTVAVSAQTYWQAVSNDQSAIDREFVYDAGFIKVRNVTLGYSIPESTLRNSFVKALTFSIVGRNLFILLKHTPNIDPESSLTSDLAQGIEYNAYPPIRNLGFNVNVKF
jgi:outer membrane receptor protein involved in Fe transport